MKLLCSKSALLYEVPEFGAFGTRYTLFAEHPIFSLSVEALLSQVKRWAAGTMNERECRLLFLAFLNSLRGPDGKLITFRTAAYPAHGIVQQYMEKLFNFVAWYSDVQTPSLRMPCYVVDKPNADLRNIKLWLDSWEEARKEWQEAAIIGSVARMEKAKRAQEVVCKVLTHATKSRKDWNILAKWAMEAASVPMSFRERWTKLFCVDIHSFKVYELSGEDIAAFKEHLESYLDCYSNNKMAFAVLERVRDIEARNRAGINHALGMSALNMLPDDLLRAQKQPFSFITENVEKINKSVAASKAPQREPTPEAYPTYGAFLKAKAAWRLHCAEQERATVALAVAAETKKAEILDAIAAREDAEYDDAELLMQIAGDLENVNEL